MVPMMYQSARLFYADLPTLQVVELPYFGNRSMFILLPKEIDGLEELESQPTSEFFEKIVVGVCLR